MAGGLGNRNALVALAIALLTGCGSDTANESFNDCHYDCFGEVWCAQGRVRVSGYGAAPCHSNPDICIVRQYDCAKGCVADPDDVLAAYQWNFGYFWYDEGGAPSPVTLCAESALPRTGTPCRSDDDCRPSLCNQLECDQSAGVCLLEGEVGETPVTVRPGGQTPWVIAELDWPRTRTEWLVPSDVQSCEPLVFERVLEDGGFEVLPASIYREWTPPCSCDCPDHLEARDHWRLLTRIPAPPWVYSRRLVGTTAVLTGHECCVGDVQSPVLFARPSLHGVEPGPIRVRAALLDPLEGACSRAPGAEDDVYTCAETLITRPELEEVRPPCTADAWATGQFTYVGSEERIEVRLEVPLSPSR